MNSINFDGRLMTNPKFRYTEKGDPVLSFQVASPAGLGKHRTTNWFVCQLWGKRAETLAGRLVKGRAVTVYGQLALREWKDKKGTRQLLLEVRVVDLVP